MNENKNPIPTKGPWKFSKNVPQTEYVIGPSCVDSERGFEILPIARVAVPDPINDKSCHDAAYADSRLIAAAPEMLEALSKAQDLISDARWAFHLGLKMRSPSATEPDMGRELDGILMRVRGAITTATGESPWDQH